MIEAGRCSVLADRHPLGGGGGVLEILDKNGEMMSRNHETR